MAGSPHNANVQTRATKCEDFLSTRLLFTEEGLYSAELAIYEIITHDYYTEKEHSEIRPRADYIHPTSATVHGPQISQTTVRMKGVQKCVKSVH